MFCRLLRSVLSQAQLLRGVSRSTALPRRACATFRTHEECLGGFSCNLLTRFAHAWFCLFVFMLSQISLLTPDHIFLKSPELHYGGTQMHFNYVWLRDHCLSPASYNSKTNQRNLDTGSIDLTIRPESTRVEEDHLVITCKWGTMGCNSGLHRRVGENMMKIDFKLCEELRHIVEVQLSVVIIFKDGHHLFSKWNLHSMWPFL